MTGSGNSFPTCRLVYLCVGWPNGPNWACSRAFLRASAGDGGDQSVVGDSSVCDVDRHMVGRDKEGELIC